MPLALLGQRVRVRWEAHLVRIFDGDTLVMVHARVAAGVFAPRAGEAEASSRQQAFVDRRVGKSHIATAIAVGAIRAGRRALVRGTFDLAAAFAQADATGARRDFVQQLTRVDLLVLEDFGMKKLGSNAAEDLLEVFVRRHETASTLITTNRPTQDWGIFLGDVPAATAILDRFLAHATIVPVTGKSYRLRQRASTTDD